MNYFGTYHADVFSRVHGICDAPCTCRGSMAIAGFETRSENKTMAMVYGRLRNRVQLAKELGCTPYAKDAELALQAYKSWEDAYAEHLEGPCVCCIADIERDRMLISRDRMGECSLFYAWREGQMMFSDHPDTLLKSGFAVPVLDREGACEIFGLGPARTPGKTPIKGLKSLEPGCMIICEGENMRVKRYFELKAEPVEDDAQTAVSRVRELLEQAVADVVHLHPACMLSGGVDSTALTALLCTRIGRVDSFSVDYEGNEQDFIANSFRPEMDAPYVRLAVRAFGTRHRQVVLHQDALAAGLDQAVRLRGFPGMGDIDSSLMLFAREILRHAPSVISGECGDEVFGGYPWFREEAQPSEDAFPWSGSLELRESILRKEVKDKLNIGEYVQDALRSALDSYDVSAVSDPEERKLFRLQRLCFDFFMPNLQERATAMCAGQGLNVLTPLCDDRLVRYVYNVPWSLKRVDGMEKGLLRSAVSDLLPEKLRRRKKSPYPKTCSTAYADAIRSRVREMAANRQAPVWKLADVDCVEKIASSALNPAETPWYGQLMAGPQMLAYLVQLNCWLEERNVQIEI